MNAQTPKSLFDIDAVPLHYDAADGEITIRYEGTWFSLVSFVAGPTDRSQSFRLLRNFEDTQQYSMFGADITALWNETSVWQTDWAKEADDLHDGYRIGSRYEVNRLLMKWERAMADFAYSKGNAIAVYEQWLKFG